MTSSLPGFFDLPDQDTLREPSPQLLERLKRLASELLLASGAHGVTTGDLRYSAENRGLLTGEESLAFMNALQLGLVIKDAGGLPSERHRRSPVRKAKRSLNVVYTLLEFAERVA
jgi:hypothetical protein